MKEKNLLKNNIIGAICLVIVLGIVPLISSAHKYSIGLNQYEWFSSTEATRDFFLYWKGRALLLICILLFVYGVAKICLNLIQIDFVAKKKYYILIGMYALFVVLSTCFSAHKEMAVWGGFQHFEGLFIHLSYVVVFLAASVIVRGKWEVRILQVGILGTVFVMAFLGAMQAWGYDFFRTNMGNKVLNFMSEEVLKISFNFEIGRVYATLYNPNYVGSYVALVLPVIVSLITLQNKINVILKNVFAVITAFMLVVMLIGSQSVTGMAALAVAALLFAILFFVRWRKNKKLICISLAVVVFGCVFFVSRQKEVLDYAWNKMVHPVANQHVINSIEQRDHRLIVSTNDGEMTIQFMGSGVGFTETELKDVEVLHTSIMQDEKTYPAVLIKTPSVSKEYMVVVKSGYGDTTEFGMYNPFEKIAGIRSIETLGFKDNLHFGSRRGYIWSRTLPLLKNHILLGSGPNTFVYEFPNDDYVGLKNVGYAGQIVTKPHNMFLQIFVQTGFLSLLAFLGIFILYVVQCIKLYAGKEKWTSADHLAIGICFGCIAYILTGLANDSTVAVAPIYWCLLGIGVALNWRVQKGETNEENNFGSN